MDKVFRISVLFAILLLIDLYIYQALSTVFRNSKPGIRKTAFTFHWAITAASLLAILIYNFPGPDFLPGQLRSAMLVSLFIIYLSKLFGVIILLIDDLRRLFLFVVNSFRSESPFSAGKEKITRSEFLSKLSLFSVGLPAATLGFGIVSGAHDYRVRRKSLSFKNLPRAFDGIKIAQISDIHTGSFFDKTAPEGGINMLLNEKPDVIFFTGDLVNRDTKEVNGFSGLLSRIQAPLGVFSTLGNHDYGDYRSWPSAKAKRKNLNDLIEAQRSFGWDILLNENRRLTISGEQIAILGVQNWGSGRFSKYGDLDKSYAGTEDLPFKILLSHDPSHWDAKVRPDHPDIDMTFSGHTHGFQFGIEIGDFRWSPSQYLYKQWADLYREDNQYLYVNRGFGYIGYPGRVGILPEITIIELKRDNFKIQSSKF